MLRYKYMKYKIKYLNLIGGSDPTEIVIDENPETLITQTIIPPIQDDSIIDISQYQKIMDSYFINKQINNLTKFHTTQLAYNEIDIYNYIKRNFNNNLNKVKILDYFKFSILSSTIILIFNNTNIDNIIYLINNNIFNIKILNISKIELIEIFKELGILLNILILELKINLININILYDCKTNLLYIVNFENSKLDDSKNQKKIFDFQNIDLEYKTAFITGLNNNGIFSSEMIKNLFNI